MSSDNSTLKQEVDRDSLESQVKDMYQRVAEDPNGEFHFEMGRALTEKLGYPVEDSDRTRNSTSTVVLSIAAPDRTCGAALVTPAPRRRIPPAPRRAGDFMSHYRWACRGVNPGRRCGPWDAATRSPRRGGGM